MLELGLEEPGLNRLVRAGFALLNLHSFFTAGPKETKAWTIPVGTVAPSAAGKIHGDFEKGFIRAEVISYQDYVACGGENGARESENYAPRARSMLLRTEMSFISDSIKNTLKRCSPQCRIWS